MLIHFVLALSVINGTAVQASRVVFALYALELGAQPFTIGILAATYSVCPMLLSVTAGRLSDRFGARWPLIIGSIGGGLGMLAPYFVSSISILFVAAAMMGFASALYNVSLQNLVGMLSTPDTRARYFSNYSLSNSLSNFVGPLIAGFLIDSAGHTATCLYVALLVLTPCAVLAVRGNRLPGGNTSAKATPAGGTGILATLSTPGVRRMLVTGSLHNTSDGLYSFYMPVYTHAIGLSASSIGIVLSMYAAAAFGVRVVLPHLLSKFKVATVLAYAFFVGATGLMLIPFFHHAAVLALLSFTFGLGMGCCGPIVTMLMYETSPQGRSGETLGLKITVNHLTKVVTPVIFGSIASVLGLPLVFWLTASMLWTGGVLSRPKNKD